MVLHQCRPPSHLLFLYLCCRQLTSIIYLQLVITIMRLSYMLYTITAAAVYSSVVAAAAIPRYVYFIS